MTNGSVWLSLLVALTTASFGGAYLLHSPSQFETRSLARKEIFHHHSSSHHQQTSSSSSSATAALYMVKKKRRKRKSESSTTSTTTSSNDMDTTTDDDLPDFDMGEDDVEKAAAAPSNSKLPSISSDEITEAMMASNNNSNKPLGSVMDLVSDRSLESKFQFDEPDSPLPDFAELAQKSRSSAATTVTTTTTLEPGSKRARQAERKAAAQARDEAEQQGGFMSNLPFVVVGGGGNSSSKDAQDDPLQFVKTLETGAWIGIFLLIAWELYINSPFFDRAAPLIPVVELFL